VSSTGLVGVFTPMRVPPFVVCNCCLQYRRAPGQASNRCLPAHSWGGLRKLPGTGYCHALGIPFEGETFACDDVRAGPRGLAPHRGQAVVAENRVCLRW